jgi:hypothetical protein
MKLSELQMIFAVNVGKLILKINEDGYSCTFGEAYRTPEQAALNAAKGIGIKNSLHCKRLAVDLNLFKDGVYCADSEAHLPFGKYWVTLNALNRWGGDWDKDGIPFEPRETDANHYEMQEAV